MIAIVSNWHDGGAGFDSLAELVMPNRRAYAVRHRYKTIESNHPGHYGKIVALLEAWPEAEWLWWLDIDAIITNPAARLESLTGSRFDVAVSCDRYGLNSGSMLLRTVPAVREILTAAIDGRGEFDRPPWHDQNAFAYLLWRIRERVCIVPKTLLNCYPEDWSEGRLVLHCPGMPNAERLSVLGDRLAKLRG